MVPVVGGGRATSWGPRVLGGKGRKGGGGEGGGASGTMDWATPLESGRLI